MTPPLPCSYRCSGGVLYVDESYVAERLAELPPDMPDDVRASQEAALRNTIKPCPRCRPEQFELWSTGHFAPGHSCDECDSRIGRKRKSRKEASA